MRPKYLGLVDLIFQCFLLERTEKLPMNSIKAVVSEPLDGHEEYHMMVCIYLSSVPRHVLLVN